MPLNGKKINHPCHLGEWESDRERERVRLWDRERERERVRLWDLERERERE